MLIRSNLDSTHVGLTRAFTTLKDSYEAAPIENLLDAAIAIIDEYLTRGNQNRFLTELAFRRFNSNLNGFLKWDQLGKSDTTPVLNHLLAIQSKLGWSGKSIP